MSLTDISPPPLLDLSAWGGGLGVVLVLYFFGALISAAARLRLHGTDLHLLRVALGFCAVPSLVLGLGQFEGVAAGSIWIIPAAAGGAWFAVSLFRAPASPAGMSGCAAVPGMIGWLACAGVVLLLLGPAFAPPINYDVLEYHLGVVAWYFETGRITPVPHMFYSAQPLATEMLYLVSAAVEGSVRAAASGVTQWCLILLVAAFAVRILARLNTPRPLVPWLVLLLLSHPIFVSLEVDRMTDLAACVPLGGAFLFRLATSRSGRDETGTEEQGAPYLVRSALMGCLAAGAVQVKWTNLGTSLPLVLALAITMPAPGASGGGLFRARLTALAAFIAGFVLVIAPWMIWLGYHAGNPFAPFLAQVFPTEAWGPERLDFLLATHKPLSFASMVYWKHLYGRLASLSLGPPLVAVYLIACGYAFAARRKAGERGVFFPAGPLPEHALLGALAFGALLWGRLAQAESRFLAPSVFTSVILLGAIAGRLSGERAVRVSLALAMLAVAPYLYSQSRLLTSLPYAAHAVGRVSSNEFLRVGMGATTDLYESANDLPHGSRIFCFGEARRYYFRHPVTMASVFDRHPVIALLDGCGSAEDLKRRLADAGFTHVLFNDFETGRLLAFHPPRPVERDPRYAHLRDGGPQSWLDAASRYRGFIEFGTDPVTPGPGEVLLEFLGRAHAAAPGRPMAIVALRDI